jgi:glycosyltransferase involved in cell wall biosynthesis
MTALHIITGLNVGGAEAMLAKLLEAGFEDALLAPQVLSLMAPGRMAARVAAQGVPIATLGMAQGRPSLAALARLRDQLRKTPPALVQGWMHHGNLVASLAGAMTGRQVPVLWNIRHSLVDIGLEKPLSRAVLRVGRMLSGTPDAIIYNSEIAAQQYRRFGFTPDRAIIIPNGFDCDRFQPRAGAGPALRRRFGIDPEPVLVAMVARQHPMKDTANLVEAIGLARAAGHDLHLLLVGTGTDAPAPALAARLARTMPPDRLTLAGELADVSDWLSGVDIVALPSAWGEAFPNILGEAMASGVPCVATDVGDSALIVGENGRIVPPRDPVALAEAIGWLAGAGAEQRRAIGSAARASIIKRYRIDRIIERYAALYRSVLAGRGVDLPRDAERLLSAEGVAA